MDEYKCDKAFGEIYNNSNIPDSPAVYIEGGIFNNTKVSFQSVLCQTLHIKNTGICEITISGPELLTVKIDSCDIHHIKIMDAPKLKVVDLPNNVLEHIDIKGKQIQEINITNNGSYLGCLFVGDILDGVPNLERLNVVGTRIYYLHRIKDKNIIHKKLTHLICGEIKSTNADIHLDGLPNLEHIEICNHTNIYMDNPKMKTIITPESHVYNKNTLCRIEHLEAAKYVNTALHKQHNMPALKYMARGDYGVSRHYMRTILTSTGCDVLDISNMPQLTSCTLVDHCDKFMLYPRDIIMKGTNSLREYVVKNLYFHTLFLKKLDLVEKIKLEDIRCEENIHIGECNKLRVLKIINCRVDNKIHITSKVMPELTTLHIDNTHKWYKSNLLLDQLPALTDLYINNVQDPINLSALPRLKRLVVRNRAENIDFTNSGALDYVEITPTSIDLLHGANIKTLNIHIQTDAPLHLKNNHITSLIVQKSSAPTIALNDMSALTSLYIKQSSITDLQICNPTLSKIVIDGESKWNNMRMSTPELTHLDINAKNVNKKINIEVGVLTKLEYLSARYLNKIVIPENSAIKHVAHSLTNGECINRYPPNLKTLKLYNCDYNLLPECSSLIHNNVDMIYKCRHCRGMGCDWITAYHHYTYIPRIPDNTILVNRSALDLHMDTDRAIQPSNYIVMWMNHMSEDLYHLLCDVVPRDIIDIIRNYSVHQIFYKPRTNKNVII